MMLDTLDTPKRIKIMVNLSEQRNCVLICFVFWSLFQSYIICLCSCLLRAMYIDVYPMLRMSAWGAMATEPWRSKKHNLHRHLETTCSTCSTCSNVDGKDRNDLRTRRTLVPGTWFPPIFGAWNYHGTGLLCIAASPHSQAAMCTLYMEPFLARKRWCPEVQT